MEGCVKMTWRWYACTTTADRLLYLHIYAQSRKHKPFANKTAPIGPYTSTQTCFCDRVLQVEDAARPHRHPPHRHWHSVNHNHSHRHSHRFRHTTTDTHKNTCTLHVHTRTLHDCTVGLINPILAIPHNLHSVLNTIGA